MKITTKNKKNQALMNKVVKALIAYNNADNLRNKADDNGDKKNLNRLNRICEDKFDKYYTLLQELPKYEQKRVESSDLY